ncbi:C40 family peptidase [Nubsella zeaxanthinifaciens]|uniref:C40 family peptidase n=1 Tax=Nubsella zeaxanthinifaciens TaxID=392412 RepID=UPI000DE2C1C1|nr:C40 family peptidase [Nubsella zeaxanthinifaciens]
MEPYHVCRVAVAPLRSEPSDRSEIVSTLLFGDRVLVIEKTEKWCFVKNHHDQYEGWMDHKQLQEITSLQYHDEQSYQYLTAVNFDNRLIDDAGTVYYLSPGSTLPFYQDCYCYLADQRFEVKTTPFIPNAAEFYNRVEATAKFFLNTPYLWGGRSFFGIDCSGFTQTVYKLCGISLKRDASQQVDHGELVDFLASAKLGDLAFFDNDEGKITHVGLMLGNDKIIHSAGKVRIDPIDNQGIFNAELDRYTHKLRVIKRIV